MTEYQSLCNDMKDATIDLRTTKDISTIMPIITRFEMSGFPDNDGVQRQALLAVTELVDQQFQKVAYLQT